MKTLCVVGPGGGDDEIAELAAQHERVIFIEPMPEMCEFHRINNPCVTVIEAACSDVDGVAEMKLYNHEGASSSLGTITDEAIELFSRFDLSCRGVIQVRTVNLPSLLESIGINELESLVTDAQGMDLTILKTMSNWLADGRIKYIQCEADGDGKRMYDGVPNNSTEGFAELMANYPRYQRLPAKRRVTWNPDLEWRIS